LIYLNNMDRILVIVSRYSRTPNDPGDFVTELSEWVNKKGYRVSVLAPHDYGLKLKENINGVIVYRFPYFIPFKYQKVAYGPGILDNLKNSFLAKLQVPFFILFELLYAIKIIRKTKSNILHTHWIIPQGLVGAICSKLFKIKHISTIHGSDINMLKNSWVLKNISRFIINNTHHITVNSTFTKNLLLTIISKNNKKKIKTIPMGIDQNRFFPAKHNEMREKYHEENLLVYVGRLIDWKGVKYLIHGLKKVIKVYPSTKLIIIGRGPEKSELEKIVNKLGLIENIDFIGEIKNTDTPMYYCIADIFVIPSIMVNGHTEGLGVVTIEAMACGTAVVGSDIGGIPDVIKDGHNGFLFPQKSPDMIAKSIIKMLSNEKIKNKFINNGLKTVQEKFSWNVVSEKFCSLF